MSDILGPPVGYTDLLDYEIKQEVREKKWQGFPLRPSAAGHCERRLAYDLMEYRGKATYPKEEREPHVWRLLNLGHSIEYSALRNFSLIKIVQPRYKQQVMTFFRLDKIDEQTEQELIEGSCDVVFVSDEYKCVLDVKSAKDGFSKTFKTRWDETLDKYSRMSSLKKLSDTAFWASDLDALVKELGDDFLVDNLIQVNLYCLSDFMRSRGIDHGVVYKYNKNDSRHYEIRFKPSKKLYDYVKNKFNNANKAVAADDVKQAKKEYQLGSMKCAFCPYKATCWEEDALKAWFNKMPKKNWPTDIGKIRNKEVNKLFKDYEKAIEEERKGNKLEQQIISYLRENKIKKVRLDNGHIYEIKYLKSPTPHFELRRTKL